MLNLTQMKQFVEWTNGRFFTIVFTKKNGQIRKMNCRLGVKKYLKNGANSSSHIEKYITVYDMQARGYRNVNLARVHSIRCGMDFINYSGALE